MNTQAKNKLVGARTALLLDHFFFGRLALYLELVEKPEVRTLAVDGRHVFYNPEFILSLSADLLKSAIVHEIMHCVFEHMYRRGGRHPRTWNMAADYAINDIIKTAGFGLGKEWLHNKAFAGMSAEHIYDIIKVDDPDGPKGKEPLDEIQDGTDQGDGVTPVEQAVEWKIAVAQAMQADKNRGKVPAGMERIAEMVAPKVPWREVLQRFITQISKDDYVWTRPNKRYHPLIMPSLYSESMGKIAVVIDTSGSIDQPTLNTFGTEIKAIIQSTRPEATTVIYCDAGINHVDTFAPNDEIQFKMYGGGGTSFVKPFLHVADEPPVALVYLTDGYGTFPAEAPEYPVLWVMTTNVTPPFGETIRIEI